MDDNKISLRVLLKEKEIFQSNRKWIYPLFDLEEFLKEHPINMNLATVHDKVVGFAAAFLILHLGAAHVHGDVMSESAAILLTKEGIPHTYTKLVKRIDCQTEIRLKEISDPNIAYEILCKTANRN